MTKDVLLSMKGMQFDINESNGGEDVEIISAAEYYNKGDHAYLVYEEIMEGIDRPVSNLVRFCNHSMEVTKKGMINVHMVFEEGKQNLSNYQTPFGNIIIGINTHKVQVLESEEKIHILVDYDLDINYEFLSKCQISMVITPKASLTLS